MFRLSWRVLAYAYRTVSGNRSSAQVEFRNVRNSAGTLLEGKKYTYDALGNITMISQSTGSYYPLVAYEYDAQNQLVKETYYNGNGTGSSNVTATYTYTYDTAGNILSETKKTGSTTSTKTYTYGNSQWNDLLTAVNGAELEYDAIGNPTFYRNGTNTYYNMLWENGRQLSFVECYNGSQSRSTFIYDANGIRKRKDVEFPGDGYTIDYVTQNGKVVRETISDRTASRILDYTYDESGQPFAVTYKNGSASPITYYYILNLQGDVVGLINTSGTVVARYTYNAWGEILSVTNESGQAITDQYHIAHLNHLRYRSYYYDTETGFYYLQSRYYDPANHRFINADRYGSTGQGFVGTNMFAYCNNNPVIYKDNSGESAIGLLRTICVYFLVHQCVQKDILEKYKYMKLVDEVTLIRKSGKAGRMDLYAQGLVWEIKHGANLELALKQANSYVGGTITSNKIDKGKTVEGLGAGGIFEGYCDITILVIHTIFHTIVRPMA